MARTARAASARFVVLPLLVLALASCGGGHDKGSDSSPSYRIGSDTIPLDTPPSGSGGVAANGPSQRTTFLLSSANGVFPNGPSRNASVSHDQRSARLIAYESDASNIVAGDSNGQTDIFLVFRAPPFGLNGTPWKAGGTQLISKGLGGAPANGPSYRPSVDGDAHHAPHCVAFISDASNLVPDDTNDKPDGFVYDARTQQITRVTVDSSGRQANGSTYSISLSGHCKRVAFTSDATNLALTQTSNPAWSTSRTTAVRAGTRQVYVRVLAGSGNNAAFKGLTFLASAADDGTAGNGDSSQPYISRSGKAVVFRSTSTNLAAGDRGSTPDVYRRTIQRTFQHVGDGDGVQVLQGSVDLVSATPDGKAGNGPSRHPSITDDGRYVAFETDASNILPDDTNGVTDIARADLQSQPPTQDWVSKTPIGGIGNGASRDPVISDAGSFVLFDSEATNLRPSTSHRLDPNGVKDVFLWNAPTRNVSLESRNAQNGYLSSPSQHPATSSRGNYVAFESADPLIDLPLSQQLFPQLVEQPSALDRRLLPQLSSPDVAAPYLPRAAGASLGFAQPPESASLAQVVAAAATAGQQVYVRYLGPK